MSKNRHFCTFSLGSGHLDAMLRSLVLAKMGRYGDDAVLAEARRRFDAHCAGTTSIPADLRAAVRTATLFCTIS